MTTVVFNLENFRKKLITVGKVLAGKKLSGLDDLYNKFIFTGEVVYAATHEVAASISLKTPFTGAVDSRTLSSVVDTFSGEEITLSAEESWLKLTASGSVAKFPLEELENQIAIMPESNLENSHEVEVSVEMMSDLCKLVEFVSDSASIDDVREPLKFIHFFSEEGSLAAYASNGFRLARAKMKSDFSPDFLNTIGLNSFFCQTAFNHKHSSKSIFRSSPSFIQIDQFTGDDKLVLQAGLIDTVEIQKMNMPESFAKLTETLGGKEFADIPAGLDSAFEQSRIFTNDKIRPRTEIRIEDNMLTLFSGQEDLNGSIKSRQLPIDLDNISVEVLPDSILLYLAHAPTKICISERVVSFSVDSENIEADFFVSTAS